MYPTESENHPDLLLTFDSNQVEYFKDLLDKLERGRQISFNATIKSFGSDMQPRHLHAHGLKIEEGYKEIAPHIHETGRYKNNNNLQRGTN